jgi:hypothetical protein
VSANDNIDDIPLFFLYIIIFAFLAGLGSLA